MPFQNIDGGHEKADSEFFLKRAEDQGKVQGNVEMEASKKRKCIEFEEADYCIVIEFGTEKLVV